MAEKELAIVVVAKGVAKAAGQILGLDRRVSHLGKAARAASSNLQRGIAVAAGLAGAGILYAAKSAADFEAQLLTINTIAREQTDGLGQLHDGLDTIGDSIRQIARESGTPLEQLTQGFYDLLSAGIKSADAAGVLRAANTLAIGGLATTDQTVDLLTTAINAYGQSASEAGHDADVFAKAIELGKVTADEISVSFANVAPIAAKMGISIEEVAAAYAALTAQGVPAAEVTTQMSRAILDLLSPNKELETLQKKTGKNFMEIARDKGLVVALNEMQTAVKGDDQAFKELFGRVEGYKFALAVTGKNQALYNADLAAMGKAGGTAAAQMAERQKGLNFQMERLRANVRDAAITIGSELIPMFADLAEEATAWITTHQPQIKQFAKDLGAGLRDAVTWLRGLNWGAITSALGTAAGFAKGMVEWFLKLPPPILAFLATGFAANKFTGGVIGDIVGELGKGLIKGVLGINAGVVNVRGGVVTGGGGVGAAGGGGLIGAIGRAVIPVAIVAASAKVAADIAGVSRDSPNRRINALGNIVRVDTRQERPLHLDPRNLSEGNKEIVDRVATARDAIETSRIALASAQRSGAAQITAAVKASQPQVNVSVVVNGDRVRVNYQASGTVKTPTGPSGVPGSGHGI